MKSVPETHGASLRSEKEIRERIAEILGYCQTNGQLHDPTEFKKKRLRKKWVCPDCKAVAGQVDYRKAVELQWVLSGDGNGSKNEREESETDQNTDSESDDVSPDETEQDVEIDADQEEKENEDSDTVEEFSGDDGDAFDRIKSGNPDDPTS